MASQSLPRFSSTKLLHALRAVRSPVQTVPPGYLTVHQWAKKWNVSRQQASVLLRAGTTAKAVEVKKFRIAMDDGTPRCIPHYAAK